MQLSKTLAIILTPFVLNCGNSESEPAKRDYRNRLAVTIPAYFELASFDIEASENVGSKVEPLFRARFRATVRLQTDTYDRVREEEGATFIRPAANDGDRWDMYGIAAARLSAGSWRIQFDLDNNPTVQNGRPRDFFTGRVILVGSEEESEFRAELEAQRLAAQQEAARAEEARRIEESELRVELEAQRLAAQQEAARAEEARRIERERIAERRTQILRSAASANRVLHGTARYRGREEPVILRFIEFDASSGRFLAHTEYPAYRGAVVKLEGRIQDGTLTGTQTEFIVEAPYFTLGSVWTLQMIDDTTLDGTFAGGAGRGSVTLVIE